MNLDDLEPAADGAALLDELRAAVVKFVILPSPEAYDAVTLWVVATHGLPAFEHATRLAIHSPVKRCGKSRLLEIIEATCHNPFSTTDVSEAVLFRVIESTKDHPPTLILDEADRMFGSAKKDEENAGKIALLNNGFRPGKPTWRCVGPQQTPTPFSNFAMAAIAGIGRKPDTIEDRAVNITMRRRLPGEKVAKFRLRTDVETLQDLRDRLAGWATANRKVLEKPPAELPDGLEDRAEDAWEPLLSVAEAAGGDWPRRARTAAKKLSSEAQESDAEQSSELRILADVKSVFAGMTQVGFLSSASLIAELRKIEDAPWGEFDFTARKLALRLGKFGIKPRHNSAKTERGYHLEDLHDAFRRYLPSEPSGSVPQDSDQQEQPDGSEAPDGSTRPDTSTRPDVSAGQTPLGRVRTVRTGDPLEPCTCTDRSPLRQANNWHEKACPHHRESA